MTTLKTLTLLAVQSAMDLLIHSKGKTSTLEVKLLLRDMGFEANQTDVSKFINEVFGNSTAPYFYKREMDSTNSYFEYSIKDLTGTADSSSATKDGDDGDGATKSVTTSPNVTINGSPNATNDGKAMPEFYVKKDDLQSTVDSYQHKNDWVVNKKEIDDNDQYHYLIFDEKMTRDQVRSRFATLNKVKINVVRASRIMNV